MVATEKIVFLKYSVLCELEKKQGIDIGVSYTNERSGKTFVHCIAEAKRQVLVTKIGNAIFFTIARRLY